MKHSEWKQLSKEEQKNLGWREAPMRNKLGAIFGLISIVVMIGMCTSGGNGAPDHYDAYKMAKTIIKEQMLDPASVEFVEERKTAHTLGDSIFIFTGVVKATNKMGLKAPMEFSVNLKYIGGDYKRPGSWEVLRLDFE